MTRIALTLSAGALPGLAALLADHAARLVECPLLSFEPPPSWSPLDAALGAIERFGAVALTSPRAAAAFRARADRRRVGAGAVAWPAVWATGPATAGPLGDRFGPVRSPDSAGVSRGGAAERLARAMIAAHSRSPVLHPCGESRREELAATLGRAGIAVEEVVCYRAVLAPEAVARDVAANAAIVVVGSPRIGRLLAAATRGAPRPGLVAVGPTTEAACRAAGWSPDAIAAEPTARAAAAALRALLPRVGS